MKISDVLEACKKHLWNGVEEIAEGYTDSGGIYDSIFEVVDGTKKSRYICHAIEVLDIPEELAKAAKEQVEISIDHQGSYLCYLNDLLDVDEDVFSWSRGMQQARRLDHLNRLIAKLKGEGK
jgi:hypothetical protein